MMTSIKKEHLPTALESIYQRHRSGEHQAADEKLITLKTELQNSTQYQSIAQLIQLIAKYEQNKLTPIDYAELANALQNQVTNIGIDLYLGWYYFLQGYFLKRAEDLTKAAEHFKLGDHKVEFYETYYWMNNYRLLPIEEKYSTYLRTYPIKSIYSRIMRNDYYKHLFDSEIIAKTQIQKDQVTNWLTHVENEVDQQFDCWFISKNSISPSTYQKLILNKDQSYLDIYSGLIDDRGEYCFLLISEINCMSYLITSQLYGPSLDDIAQFLNKTNDEAKKTIESLISLGIKISLQDNFYFISWEAKPQVIIPRTLKVIGLQEFVKKNNPKFTKDQLIELLQITPFGAEALLKKWTQAGFLRPLDQVNWTFN